MQNSDANAQTVELLSKIQNDRAQAKAQFENGDKQLVKMRSRFARVRVFGYERPSLKVPVWLAVTLVGLFVGVLLWAAFRGA